MPPRCFWRWGSWHPALLRLAAQEDPNYRTTAAFIITVIAAVWAGRRCEMDLVTAAEDAGITVLCPGFKQGDCCQLPAKFETAVPKKGPSFPASSPE